MIKIAKHSRVYELGRTGVAGSRIGVVVVVTEEPFQSDGGSVSLNGGSPLYAHEARALASLLVTAARELERARDRASKVP